MSIKLWVVFEGICLAADGRVVGDKYSSGQPPCVRLERNPGSAEPEVTRSKVKTSSGSLGELVRLAS